MWCVGARWIPYAGQNTIDAIEFYHCNLEGVLKSAKERFLGRRMDWLIYHLTCDVLTHYWYIIQCKAFGFIRDKKQEGIVVSATTYLTHTTSFVWMNMLHMLGL